MVPIEKYRLSILSMRFRDTLVNQIKIPVSDSFNSLYEILPFRLSAFRAKTSAFNSLYEIPCINENMSEGTNERTFNSLYEIHKEVKDHIASKIMFTFNSLYEIHADLIASSGTTITFTFQFSL